MRPLRALALVLPLSAACVVYTPTPVTQAPAEPVQMACSPLGELSAAQLAVEYSNAGAPVPIAGAVALRCECSGRALGGGAESRSLGGDTEARSLGGDTEDRQLAGDTESRDLAGDTEARALGGDTEDRELAGATEGRELGGDIEARALAGDTEARDLGGDTEARALAGDTEARALGGDTEARALGGDTEGIACEIVPVCSGYVIKGSNAVSYFDGQAVVASPNGCVP